MTDETMPVTYRKHKSIKKQYGTVSKHYPMKNKLQIVYNALIYVCICLIPCVHSHTYRERSGRHVNGKHTRAGGGQGWSKGGRLAETFSFHSTYKWFEIYFKTMNALLEVSLITLMHKYILIKSVNRIKR